MKPSFPLIAFFLTGAFTLASALPDPFLPGAQSAETSPSTPVPDNAKATANAKREKRFSKLDVNSDSFVDRDEFKKSRAAVKKPERAEKRFVRCDKNSDGKLSKDEWLAAPAGGKKAKTKA